MNYLVKAITEYKTGEDHFNVFNFEAGLGKSYTVDRLLKYINNDYEEWDNIIEAKYLIVKRFNEESIKSAKFTKHEFNPNSLAITHENWREWMNKLDDLKHQKIIFISHQRYISLCENEEFRRAITAGRDTLIIDEKVMFPVYTYNDKRYSKMFEILPNGLREILIEVCRPLNEFIELQKTLKHTNKVLSMKFKVKKEILSNYNSEMELALNNSTIRGTDNRRWFLKDFLRDINLLYTNQSIYNGGNISTYNPLHKHWGLENNLILDASGGIDGVYLSNPEKFNLINQTRIVEHGESEFNIINFNSSKSNIEAHDQYYFKEIASKIAANKELSDKVLIVGNKDSSKRIREELLGLKVDKNEIWVDKEDKDNDPDYDNQPYAISWYGNLIGKNWASDFTQVWLVSTPNIPLEQYLVHYLHYSDEQIGNKSTQIYKGRFKNFYFKSIQEGYIAAEMYQSLKRIQRVAIPKGKFFIVNADENITNSVLSQMKNSNNRKEIELDFVKALEQERERKKSENKKPDQVDKFLDYILVQDRGTYKKSDISKQLSITKLNRVLSDSRVKTLLNKRYKIHTRSIEVI